MLRKLRTCKEGTSQDQKNIGQYGPEHLESCRVNEELRIERFALTEVWTILI
jgi:hypothetical protein